MLLNRCILAPLNFHPPQERGKGEVYGNGHELHRFMDTSRAAKKWGEVEYRGECKRATCANQVSVRWEAAFRLVGCALGLTPFTRIVASSTRATSIKPPDDLDSTTYTSTYITAPIDLLSCSSASFYCLIMMGAARSVSRYHYSTNKDRGRLGHLPTCRSYGLVMDSRMG